jgi:hypothetical protein
LGFSTFLDRLRTADAIASQIPEIPEEPKIGRIDGPCGTRRCFGEFVSGK